MVTSLNSIGWTDPFPKPVPIAPEIPKEILDPQGIPTTGNKYAQIRLQEEFQKKISGYNEWLRTKNQQTPSNILEENGMAYVDSLYSKDRSPMCVYMPSNAVLFKIMRACIGCENIEDLWISSDQEIENQ